MREGRSHELLVGFGARDQFLDLRPNVMLIHPRPCGRLYDCRVSIENIQKTVADYYKIKVSEMYSKKRTRNVARPRQVAMALAKELTQMSLPDIGEAFGGRDHTTVLHACRKIAELRGSSTDITTDITSLLKVLRS